MIPYFELQTLSLGPLTLNVWGLFVAFGFLAGIMFAYSLARKQGRDPAHILGMATWALPAALIGARFVHVFFYDWSYYRMHGEDIIKIWEGGLASLGGQLGAAIAILLYIRWHHLRFWEWVDAIIIGVPLGIAIGRIGPFFGHLHPGIHSFFFLTVQYPEGARHDLDLYLALNGLILFSFFLFARYKQRPYGFFFVSFLLWYGTTRFLLDFLRAHNTAFADPRFFGLTPAQYGMIIYIILGISFSLKSIRTQR